MHLNLVFILVAITGIIQSSRDDSSKIEKKTPARELLLYYSLPVYSFLVLYSFLPHKELRFIIPVVPVLFLGAAIGFSSITAKLSTITKFKMARQFLIWSHVLFSMTISIFFLYISSLNYFGGYALKRLNTSILLMEGQRKLLQPFKVHIDADAAMSGVSRFGEIHTSLNKDSFVFYSKEENLQLKDLYKFDGLVTSNSTLQDLTGEYFYLAETIYGFQRVNFDRSSIRRLALMTALKIELEEKLFIYYRKEKT
jgi:hypothetical protein